MSRIEALRVVSRALVGAVAAGALAACAHAPVGPTYQAGAIDPGQVLPRAVELVVVVDASLSMADSSARQPKLTTARAVATSLVETVPAGMVAGSVRSFGQGDCLPSPSTWALYRGRPFAAAEAAAAIAKITCTGGDSPLDKALVATDLSLVTTAGPVAVVVVSDGSHMGEPDLAAAERLRESRDGGVCYYPIQVGTSTAGAAFLGRLAALGDCGRLAAACDLADGAAMAAFVAAVLFEADSDGDRVGDDDDRCPDTPPGATVDAVGCPLDGDGDGVPDFQDRCQGTPAGTGVDFRGCPVDSDADRVTDDQDNCPDTPRGVKVDASGCPLDSDGDGVGDTDDRCPGTPHRATVDAAGCPLDSDGDGVSDDADQCDDTPPGAPVDEDGCPLAGVEVVNDEWHVAGDLLFDLDRATVSAGAQPILDHIATWLGRNPTVTLTIEGHTDASGSTGHNLELSERRAAATRDYLVAHGVAASRLTSVGKGESEPVAGNDSDADRQKNRRVELVPNS